MGYSPWGHKESDATERLAHTSVSLGCRGSILPVGQTPRALSVAALGLGEAEILVSASLSLLSFSRFADGGLWLHLLLACPQCVRTVRGVGGKQGP